MAAEKSQRYQFVTGHPGVFEATAASRTDESGDEIRRAGNQEAVGRMLDWLSERERGVVVRRFGLEGARVMTLSQLGKELGVTRQRVRQIEARAREKLREFARERGLDTALAACEYRS
jgi:RNA polymerase sigma factor (sigma-70 family)